MVMLLLMLLQWGVLQQPATEEAHVLNWLMTLNATVKEVIMETNVKMVRKIENKNVFKVIIQASCDVIILQWKIQCTLVLLWYLDLLSYSCVLLFPLKPASASLVSILLVQGQKATGNVLRFGNLANRADGV